MPEEHSTRIGRLGRLVFPEPDENPVSAQLEALWMLGFSMAGYSIGGLSAPLFGYSTELGMTVGLLLPMLLFTIRFGSKARGWQ